MSSAIYRRQRGGGHGQSKRRAPTPTEEQKRSRAEALKELTAATDEEREARKERDAAREALAYYNIEGTLAAQNRKFSLNTVNNELPLKTALEKALSVAEKRLVAAQQSVTDAMKARKKQGGGRRSCYTRKRMGIRR